MHDLPLRCLLLPLLLQLTSVRLPHPLRCLLRCVLGAADPHVDQHHTHRIQMAIPHQLLRDELVEGGAKAKGSCVEASSAPASPSGETAHPAEPVEAVGM